MRRLIVDVQPGNYVVARLPADAAVPDGLLSPDAPTLVSVTRTADELSIICLEGLISPDAVLEKGWRLLTVRGRLEFTLTGIIAALSSELAAAGVALFSLSTFDTDHVLVKATELERAEEALRAAGHEVHIRQ